MTTERNTKYDNALLKFIGTSPEWCRQPREYGDYVYATDTHILLRVRKSLCHSWLAKHKNQPKDITKCMPEADMALKLDILEIAEVIKKLEPIETTLKCADCGGNGYVLWSYEDLDGTEHTKRDECPVCDGSGKVTALLSVTEQNIEINGDWFNIGLLMIILDTCHNLGADTVTVEHIGEYRAMRIKVTEDVDALIMPNKTCTPTAHFTLK